MLKREKCHQLLLLLLLLLLQLQLIQLLLSRLRLISYDSKTGLLGAIEAGGVRI